MSSLEGACPEGAVAATPAKLRSSTWDIVELTVGYGLVMAVIWTPRPIQRWLYWAAIGWFLTALIMSFPGWKAMGCCIAGFWRSLWVVGVAVVMSLAAIVVAVNLHTLHRPDGPFDWLRSYGGYAVWAFLQQLLLQGYFLLRLLRIVPNSVGAALIAAGVFSIAHLPNPILTPITLIWGLTACLIFIRSRNVYPLAMAHAIFGICVAITIPGPMLHNMRVGRGYLTYKAPRPVHLSQSDHTVSTVAWVIEEAPARWLARHARP
ncbi:MAG TPA: CPBP family intramembrane glutamic endopeptidase [Terracidiphilus sp.]|nr:CPBP family intramembrane glutamic endopeptidase [Terracidiphilus sp.]